MPTRNGSLAREIRTIQQAVRQLTAALVKVDTVLAQAASANGALSWSEEPSRKPTTITPARLRALKLQGRYIGTIRTLPARKKAAVKKIYAEKGIKAAIRAAERMTER